jgi:hypothetical protein
VHVDSQARAQTHKVDIRAGAVKAKIVRKDPDLAVIIGLRRKHGRRHHQDSKDRQEQNALHNKSSSVPSFGLVILHAWRQRVAGSADAK